LIVILLSPLPVLCFLHLLHPLLLFLSPSQKVFLIGFFAFFFVITLDVVDLFLIVLDRIVFPFFIVAEVVIGSTGVFCMEQLSLSFVPGSSCADIGLPH
jgi:hypothetical protein